ncbi:GL20609 [Drosophila persimilis]|uniref:GL20609 n=1 Tax=Drosophila persimilis TaxID=7234 RepID=B4G421_DROPE|nr:GL20609 [Drosophila persimilis]
MSQTLDDLLLRQEHARQLRQVNRSKFRRINSLDLIPEHPSQDESEDEDGAAAAAAAAAPHKHFVALRRQRTADGSLLRSHSQSQFQQSQERPLGTRMLLFGPQLLMRVLLTLLRYILYIPLSIAAPSFWLSALLWIFWKLLRVPIAMCQVAAQR